MERTKEINRFEISPNDLEISIDDNKSEKNSLSEEAQYGDGAPEVEEEADDQDYYIVEKILDKKMHRGGVKYKVKWVGWPESQCTWEPLQNLENVQELVCEFEDQLRAKRKHKAKAHADKAKNIKTVTNNKKLPANAATAIDLGGAPDNRSVEEPKPSEDQSKTDQEKNNLRKKKFPSDEGHLKYNDKPLKILSSKMDKEESKVLFLIEWRVREDGTKPLPSYMSNEEFKKYNPVFLLEYYETRMVFCTKKDTNTQNQNSVPSTSHDRMKAMEFDLRSSLAKEALEKNLELEKKTSYSNY